MKVQGVDAKQLRAIANDLGLIIVITGEKGKSKKWVHFRLKPKLKKKYRKFIYNYIARSTRAVYACCSHAFFDFIEKIFEVNEEAVVKSSTNSFRGIWEFEEKAKRDINEWDYNNNVIDVFCHCKEIEEANRKRRETKRKNEEKKVYIEFAKETEEGLFHQ